jgi:dipeptidyl aminopeptidase/acylaminoacyl peptidase
MSSVTRLSRQLAFLSVALLSLALPLAGQGVQQTGTPNAAAPADPTRKKPLSIEDYSRWRTIEGAQISSDGKYAAYVLRHTNVPQADSRPALHIVRLDDDNHAVIQNASQPTFSPDGRWLAYQVEMPRPQGGRGGRGGAAADSATSDSAGRGRAGAPAAAQRRMELRELATGATKQWQNMTGATFNATSSHVLFRRTPNGGGGGGGRGGNASPPAGGAPLPPPSNTSVSGSGVQTATPRGAEVILHNLGTGRSLFIGAVGDAAFNRTGSMLAYTIDGSVRDGNGIFAIDLPTGRTLPLDNDSKTYNRLTWNDDGTSVAVLKGTETPRMRERANMVLVVGNVKAGFDNPSALTSTVLDAATATSFPKGFVISDRTPLLWSDDDSRVFFGIIPQTPAPDTSRRRGADSVADLDVWGSDDERVQSQQMAIADQERNFTFRQAFDVAGKKFVRLTDSTMKDIDIAENSVWSVGRDSRGYISDWEPARADLYRVNTLTGERTLIEKGQLMQGQVFGISPNGKYFTYWKGLKFQAYDLAAGKAVVLGGATAPSFVDTEDDHPGPKSPFGVMGYSKDGTGFLAEHRYDIWQVPFDGGPAKVLTNAIGTRQEIKFSLARLQPIDPAAPRAERDPRVVDLSKPVVLAAYGQWTKKAGFYELSGGQMKALTYEDAVFSTPVKAAKADRYMFTRQTFAEFPDIRIGSYGFQDSKRISDANPQQAEFLWGHRVLFDYKLKDGTRAQGILALPDDYQPGEKRPMIVSFYEKNSQNMHRYSPPSFVTGMGSLPMEAVTKGYITMFADVYYRTGQSHSDQLEAVEAATRKVIELGYADPKNIGLNGHSYGGEGAQFIATRSRLFKAVGAGAGVTDLFTDFSQSWGWSYQNQPGTRGANGLQYYYYGQGRWGFSPWDKPDVFHFESAITHANETTAAVLLMHGTADPTVSFNESLKFYTALRFNKKDATLLAYVNEGHGLRGLANRKDLTTRYMQFFDHYLKGAPAPDWLSKGVPFLVKEATLNNPLTPKPIVP